MKRANFEKSKYNKRLISDNLQQMSLFYLRTFPFFYSLGSSLPPVHTLPLRPCLPSERGLTDRKSSSMLITVGNSFLFQLCVLCISFQVDLPQGQSFRSSLTAKVLNGNRGTT